MGGGGIPQMPSPEDSARAEAMAQLAGSEFNLGTAPLQAYAQAIDSLQFDPTFQKIQSANQANSALAAAQANKQINAQVNPYGSAGQDAFNARASQRLAMTMGSPYNPGTTPTPDTAAFNYPTSQSLPTFGDIMKQSKGITSAMPNVNIGRGGVSLNYPGTFSPVAPSMGSMPSYFSASQYPTGA